MVTPADVRSWAVHDPEDEREDRWVVKPDVRVEVLPRPPGAIWAHDVSGRFAGTWSISREIAGRRSYVRQGSEVPRAVVHWDAEDRDRYMGGVLSCSTLVREVRKHDLGLSKACSKNGLGGSTLRSQEGPVGIQADYRMNGVY